MKEKKMKMILSLGVILLLIIVGVLIIVGIANRNKGNEEIQGGEMLGEEIQAENIVEEFVEVESNGTKVNVSNELKKNKKVDGLEISNIRLVENGNLSQITADVKNTTSSVGGDFEVDIKVMDKEGRELYVVGGYIDRVNPGETVMLNASVTADVANAYDFEIISKK